jgi:hypothetical protein
VGNRSQTNTTRRKDAAPARSHSDNDVRPTRRIKISPVARDDIALRALKMMRPELTQQFDGPDFLRGISESDGNQHAGCARWH